MHKRNSLTATHHAVLCRSLQVWPAEEVFHFHVVFSRGSRFEAIFGSSATGSDVASFAPVLLAELHGLTSGRFERSHLVPHQVKRSRPQHIGSRGCFHSEMSAFSVQ